MNDLTKHGNLIEAGLWFVVSLVLAVQTIRTGGKQRRWLAILAAAFLVFGISDLIESQTGAWWRPLWLLLMKGSCVAVFVIGFVACLRIKKNTNA